MNGPITPPNRAPNGIPDNAMGRDTPAPSIPSEERWGSDIIADTP